MVDDKKDNKEKKDRKEYMKAYHRDKQQNDAGYRTMKNLNAKNYYNRKYKDTEYMSWYRDMIKMASIVNYERREIYI